MYECNLVPGSWHLAHISVEDAPKFEVPPSPETGGGRPLMDVIADLLVDAIKDQGPGLLMPLTSLRKHFSLSGPQFGEVGRRLIRAKWMRKYELGGHWTAWPHNYAKEHGPRNPS